MRNLIFILFLVIFSSSCYSPRYVYSPAAQNIPLLNNKGDYKLGAFYSTGSLPSAKKNTYNNGLDVHTAYAISNHFGLMINEFLRWEKNDGKNDFYFADSSTITYKRNLTELGIGYFTNITKDKNLKLQVFAGSAFGKSSIKDIFLSNGSAVRKYHDSRITKFFIQPAILYNQSFNFSATLSSRFSAVSFEHIKTNYTKDELNNFLLDSLSGSTVFFWEPAMSYTFSFKKLKSIRFEVQTTLSVLLNHRFIDYRSFNAAFGVLTDFSSHKKASRSFQN